MKTGTFLLCLLILYLIIINTLPVKHTLVEYKGYVVINKDKDFLLGQTFNLLKNDADTFTDAFSGATSGQLDSI